MSEGLLSLPAVCAKLGGCHRATVYRLVQSGELPPPVKLGSRSAWPESEIVALIERLKAARNVGQIAGESEQAA